jgi:hypothetical protein
MYKLCAENPGLRSIRRVEPPYCLIQRVTTPRIDITRSHADSVRGVVFKIFERLLCL